MNEQEIYQGEPISATIFVKIDDEYQESLDGYAIEAMLYNNLGKVVRSWSTAKGDLIIKTVIVDDNPVGCASFGSDGNETAEWQVGVYTLEVAQVISDGRKIGKTRCLFNLRPAMIRKGV